MDNQTRKDLYKMLRGLSIKLEEIASDSDDLDTTDKLNELVSVIDESVDQLILNRKERESL